MGIHSSNPAARLGPRTPFHQGLAEKSGTVHLARTLSRNMDATVKENVEIVRRPSQQMGEHFQESFKGVVRKRPGAEAPKPEPAA